MRVPALSAGNTPTHRHPDAGVNDRPPIFDAAAAIHAAATSPAVSDRALRVYVAVVTANLHRVDGHQVAALLPSLTPSQAARLLGDLTRVGLFTKRVQVIGTDGEGNGIRRTVYRLVGGDRA